MKAVSSQVPFVSGSANFRCLVRADFVPGLLSAFEAGTCDVLLVILQAAMKLCG